MSGLIALLDDVAGIAKVAAASIDDVAGQAAKASAKAAGAVIDDAAVTPKYVQGFEAKRELPIIGRIAWGSIKNKLIILLPIALLLSAFASWAIAPLLMLGGAYLCFEGAEKVWHTLFPHEHTWDHAEHDEGDPAHLEEAKIAGAIKTDFILSAEIMTIILSGIPNSNFWMEAATLAVAAVGITVAVYGSVALIVKADDFGLYLANNARLSVTQALGRGIVKAMPYLHEIAHHYRHRRDDLGGWFDHRDPRRCMNWVWHEPYNSIHHIADGRRAFRHTGAGLCRMDGDRGP